MRSGVLGATATSGKTNVHVHQHVAQPGTSGGIHGLGGVDGDGDHRRVLGGSHQRQAGGVQHLVGQQQVVTEAGSDHSQHLSRGRAGERAMPVRPLCRGQRGAFVGLHMRPQGAARMGGGHGGQVGLQQVSVDDQRWSRQVVNIHRC